MPSGAGHAISVSSQTLGKEQNSMLTFDVAFKGAAEDKKLAGSIFDVMRGHGRFMAADEPIRVSIDSIIAYLAETAGTEVDSVRIASIVKKNSEVFALEERDGVQLLVTTRSGRVPTQRVMSAVHTFAERFMTPLPKPEAPALPPRERPRVAQQWGDISHLIEPYLDMDVELETMPALEDESAV